LASLAGVNQNYKAKSNATKEEKRNE
jgi:hypothetical protein